MFLITCINKPLYPASIPTTLEDLAIEQAIARLVIRQALRQTALRYPLLAITLRPG